MTAWELVIIGAGSAGLAAGIYASRSGLKTLVIEEKSAGGTTAEAPLVENYPGFQSISGSDLAQMMITQARGAGVIIQEFETVTSMDLKSEPKVLKTNKARYETRTVIIASGRHYREMGVPGEKEFRGRGVSYCGICDGPLFKGKRLLIVGGGNSALITALYLSGIASDVKIAHRRDTFRAEEALSKALKQKANIEVLWNTEVRQIAGEKLVTKALLFNNKTRENKELPVDGVFVQIGEDPNSQLAHEAGVTIDEDGYIIVDTLQRTNIAGVYAAGDVASTPVKQIGTAVGQGITAAMEAYAYVRRPYYRQ
jgi:thioredoxin reductase (NADPH)